MLKCNRITRVTVLLLAMIVWPHALKAVMANDSKTNVLFMFGMGDDGSGTVYQQ